MGVVVAPLFLHVDVECDLLPISMLYGMLLLTLLQRVIYNSSTFEYIYIIIYEVQQNQFLMRSLRI